MKTFENESLKHNLRPCYFKVKACTVIEIFNFYISDHSINFKIIKYEQRVSVHFFNYLSNHTSLGNKI